MDINKVQNTLNQESNYKYIISQKVDGLVVHPSDSHIEIKLPENIHSTFIKNMKSVLSKDHFKFVQSILNLYGNKLCIAGGFCTNMLLGIKKFDDIDFFFHSLMDSQGSEELDNVYKLVDGFNKKHKHSAIHYVSGHAVTLFIGKIKLQFITKCFSSIQAILDSFDLSPACIAYDGDKVYVSDKAKKAFEDKHCTLDVDKKSLTYERRICKYFRQKGFGIRLPNFDISKVIPGKEIVLPMLLITPSHKNPDGSWTGEIHLPENDEIGKFTYAAIEAHNASVTVRPNEVSKVTIVAGVMVANTSSSADMALVAYGGSNANTYILMNKYAQRLGSFGFLSSDLEGPTELVEFNWLNGDYKKSDPVWKQTVTKAWYADFYREITAKESVKQGWSEFDDEDSETYHEHVSAAEATETTEATPLETPDTESETNYKYIIYDFGEPSYTFDSVEKAYKFVSLMIRFFNREDDMAAIKEGDVTEKEVMIEYDKLDHMIENAIKNPNEDNQRLKINNYIMDQEWGYAISTIRYIPDSTKLENLDNFDFSINNEEFLPYPPLIDL